MNRYVKISAALAAFALLLVVMGLSTQNVVHAQDPEADVMGTYVCSHDADATPRPSCSEGDATFDIVITNASATPGHASSTIEIFNSNLARVGDENPGVDLDPDTENDNYDNPDANPKVIKLASGNTTLRVTVVRKSSDLMDGGVPDSGIATAITVDGVQVAPIQIKGFNGNDIQITYAPGGSQFAVIESVTVDNVKPQLITNSPAAPLIVQDKVALTFSADLTDGGSGYSKNVGRAGDAGPASMDIDDMVGDEGPLNDATTGNPTEKGGVRLVVAGNVVELKASNFEKIDGGWRVSKTINSSAIQSINANVPWYFVTRDRAGNTTRTTTRISGGGGEHEAMALTDAKYKGSLHEFTFVGSSIRITRQDAKKNNVTGNRQSILTFAPGTGTFTFANDIDDPLFGSPRKAEIDDLIAQITDPTNPLNQIDVPKADFAVGDYLYTCPFAGEAANTASEAARDAAATEIADNGNTSANNVRDDVITEVDAANVAQIAACGAGKRVSYEILGSNLITVDSESLRLVSAETGVGYNSGTKKDKTQKNSIKVVFADDGKTENDGTGSGLDASTVTASAFSVSGNSVESVTVVKNSVYLTLAENLGSTERPSVSAGSGQLADKAGNGFSGRRVDKAEDSLGPNLTLSKSADLSNDRVTVTITTDEQLGKLPTVSVVQAAGADGKAAAVFEDDADGKSVHVGNVNTVSQTGAKTYSFSKSDSSAGEFNVYVTAEDTGGNESAVGDKKSSSDADSFSFELDKALNGGDDPIFSVADFEDVTDLPAGTTTAEIEQVDPLIVTVDFSGEGLARGKEYSRDSFRTVELTSAKLRVTFSDGSFEDRTFNLTTEISSPNSVKFTIPLLNPKIGAYKLTVKAVDSAGNVRIDGTGTTAQDLVGEWDVVKPSPVDIDLAPGWNLVSLPFQPANPAINSVINASHPAEIVMTFDNASQVWMVSRRDAETGLFVGDIVVMTASTAYFILTENFQAIRMLRPPLATAAAAPPPPPAITVVKGWNLVPIVSNNVPVPEGVAADEYFGTLGADGWLKALTFDTLSRTWASVTPGDTVTLTHGDGEDNPCTGKLPVEADVEDRSEPCQMGEYNERSKDNDEAAVEADPTANPPVVAADASDGGDGFDNAYDGEDRVTLRVPVVVGKGYWLYSNVDGVIIP